MRANTHRVDSDDTSIDGFVRLLDHFAALPARAPAHRARRDNGHPQARRAVPDDPLTAIMLARTRVGFAGLIVILLVGGLGFALWTGPQSCHGCDDALVVAPSAQASDSAATASRLQYTATADLGEILKQQPSQSAHDWSAPSKRAEVGSAKLPAQSVSAAAQAADNNIAPSPMTTSARGRIYEPQSLTASKPPRHGGRRPEVAAEVSDAALKPLKLTAANEITNEIVPTQSVLAVERSPGNEISAVDLPARKPKASSQKPPQMQSERRGTTARARRKVKAAQSARVPGWAKKMFDGNWQGGAFSYQYR